MAERFRLYLDRDDPPPTTLDRTGADRLLDRLRAEYREPRVDTAPQLLKPMVTHVDSNNGKSRF
jgi:hypothetical protein